MPLRPRQIPLRAEVAFVLPLLAYLILFALVPLLSTVRMSFSDPTTQVPTLENYRHIVSQSGFLQALVNTLAISALGVASQVGIGLVLALLLTQNLRGRGAWRTIFLLPLGIPTVVVGVTFTYLFSTSGYVNEVLLRLGAIQRPMDWVSGGFPTLLSIVLTDLWKVTPLMTLLLMAGLESIDREFYEAAEMDGASKWNRFRHITMPLLRPILILAIALRSIDALRIFEVPLVLTGRTTQVLSTFAYFEFFEYNHPHRSAAASVILLVLIAAIIVLLLRWRATSEEGRP